MHLYFSALEYFINAITTVSSLPYRNILIKTDSDEEYTFNSRFRYN